MAWMVRLLPDAYLREIADHFAAQHPPAPPPARAAVGADVLERGRRIALGGDPARGVPACARCHGRALTGVTPAVPGLLGLPRDYLNAQLGAWRNGLRRAAAPDCMADVARRMSADDVAAVTAWLASRPPPADEAPAPAAPEPPPLRCGDAGTDAVDANRPGDASRDAPSDPAVLRGRQLALAGNCAGCHTARGGAPYAGGRPIESPFGVFFAPNLTPDDATGLGKWSADDFWRALHEGRSRDGSALYPSFPYPNYTRVTRADADALHAYLRSLAPVRQPNRPHALRFPYDRRALLSVWRALWFRPGEFRPDPGRPAQWNRGAYLVQGLGHCSACHSQRNRFGANLGAADFGGGQFGESGWYAPSLASDDEAGLGGWGPREAAALLGRGVSAHASASGPMASVVVQSLQHLPADDIAAIVAYLTSLAPERTRVRAGDGTREDRSSAMPSPPATPGARIYERHCADCHGRDGEGAPGAYPALSGNRAVTLARPGNVVRAVLLGGFAPATAGNPRPYGMPAFGISLSDAEVAAVVSYIRGAWKNRAGTVSASDVNRWRSSAP